MLTQYKLIMRHSVEQNSYYMRSVPEDYVENADEEIFASGLSEDQINYFNKLSGKQRRKLIDNVISSMKFNEQVKKMNISELKEHFFELTNYFETIDVEAILKKQNKHKLVHQLNLKFSEFDCIKEEINRRLDKIKGEHELILT